VGNRDDDLTFGISEGWDNTELWFTSGGTDGWRPGYFADRDIGAREDTDGDRKNRAQYYGRRVGQKLYLDAYEQAVRFGQPVPAKPGP
jgi:hypothetical protein